MTCDAKITWIGSGSGQFPLNNDTFHDSGVFHSGFKTTEFDRADTPRALDSERSWRSMCEPCGNGYIYCPARVFGIGVEPTW